jgi:hypothetical protein
MPAAISSIRYCAGTLFDTGTGTELGTVIGGETGAGSGGAEVVAVLGIFNFCPTLILVVDKLFSDSIALKVVP